jgi:hypothetical protein
MLVVHVRSQLKLFRAIRHVREACQRENIVWDYWGNLPLRIKFLFNARSMFRPTDSAEIAAAKQALVAAKAELYKKVFPQMIKIMLVGMLLTILTGIVYFAIIGKE